MPRAWVFAFPFSISLDRVGAFGSQEDSSQLYFRICYHDEDGGDSKVFSIMIEILASHVGMLGSNTQLLLLCLTSSCNQMMMEILVLVS